MRIRNVSASRQRKYSAIVGTAQQSRMNRFFEAQLAAGAARLSCDILPLAGENAHTKCSVFTQPDFIAVNQRYRWLIAVFRVSRRHRCVALTNFFAVDVGAVQTAEIADAEGGRSNFE